AGYGGSEFHVHNGSVVLVGNGGRIYLISVSGGQTKPIAPKFCCAASTSKSPVDRWVMYEHHDGRTDGLAVVDIDGSEWGRKLAFGTDFVMQPAWHPAGTHIAYIVWNHPQMPWDGTELRLAKLAYDRAGFPYVESIQTIAGDADTSVFQPEFSPDGKTLAYVSDASGWWQIYLYNLKTGKHTQLTTAEAEHAVPAWVQGIRTYGWSRDGKAIYSIRNEKSVSTLWCYDVKTGKSIKKRDDGSITNFDDYTELRQISICPTRDALALLASSGTSPEQVVSYDSERDATHQTLELLSLYQPNQPPLQTLAGLYADDPTLTTLTPLNLLWRLKGKVSEDPVMQQRFISDP